MQFNNYFFSGTSNVEVPEPNKTLYPELFRQSSKLSYYASIFNSVEINRSFYTIPRPSTIAKWNAETPSNFKFSFKLWKGITHNKLLEYDKADIVHFMNAISPAADKKAAVLVQIPASIKAKIYFNKLLNLLESIIDANNENWPIAFEARDYGFYEPEFVNKINQLGVSFVHHDMPQSATPKLLQQPFEYYRFHGVLGDYRGSYSKEKLMSVAKEIAISLKERKMVCAYFNNTIGSAVQNAIELKKMLSEYSNPSI